MNVFYYSIYTDINLAPLTSYSLMIYVNPEPSRSKGSSLFFPVFMTYFSNDRLYNLVCKLPEMS